MTDTHQLKLLNLTKPSEQRELTSELGVLFVSLSSDSRWAVTRAPGPSCGFEIWDIQRSERIKHLLSGGSGWFAFARFSPDGKWLAAGSPDVQIYETDTWRCVQHHSAAESVVAFSPDSRMLATQVLGEHGYLIKLVDVATGNEIARLEAPHPRSFGWLEFSPDGAILAAAEPDLALWDISLIRQQLRKIDLDWSHPPLVRQPKPSAEQPLIEVELGFLDTSVAPQADR